MKLSIIALTLDGGGAEKVAVNLANYYVSIGHDVDIVLLKMQGQYLSLVNEKVNLIDLSSRSYLFATFKLRSYFKKNKENLVLSVIRSANILTGIATIGFKVKSLTYREANTMDAINRMNFVKKKIYILFMKYSYKKADRIIANSFDTKRDLVDQKIIQDKQAKVIVNPVLPLNYKTLLIEKCSHTWLNDKKLQVVLAVGRLHQQKNFSFLIECFADVVTTNNNARLVIVGEGEEKERLQKQIEKFNMQKYIDIENFQSNIFPYYKKASVFALCSLWEGFGNVIVEALSAGTPVIATNCPGGPKMILKKGKYGKLIEPGDRKGYIEALSLKLKNHYSKDTKLIRYSQKFSVQNIGNEYLKIMNAKA